MFEQNKRNSEKKKLYLLQSIKHSTCNVKSQKQNENEKKTLYRKHKVLLLIFKRIYFNCWNLPIYYILWPDRYFRKWYCLLTAVSFKLEWFENTPIRETKKTPPLVHWNRAIREEKKGKTYKNFLIVNSNEKKTIANSRLLLKKNRELYKREKTLTQNSRTRTKIQGLTFYGRFGVLFRSKQNKTIKAIKFLCAAKLANHSSQHQTTKMGLFLVNSY